MPGDAKFAKVALLLRGQEPDGSELIVDESYPPKVLTSFGGAANTTADKKYGVAGLTFDGTDAWVTADATSQFELGSLDSCAECWIKTTSTVANATIMARGSSGFGVGSWTLMINTSASAGDVQVFVRDFSAGTPLLRSQGVDIRDGSWHHVAWARDGSLHYLLIDGVLRGAARASFTIGAQNEKLVVGNDLYFSPRRLGATLDDVRLTVGDCRYPLTSVLPTSEAPTASPADPYFASVSTLLRGNGADGGTTFTDDATTPKTYTASGNAQTSTAQMKFGSASLKFDGSGDRLTAAAHADFNLSGGDYTVECWVRFASVASTPHVFQLGTGAGARMNLYLSSGQLFFYSGASYATGFSPVVDQWYHLALMKQGSAYYVLVNGLLQWGQFLSGTATPTGDLSVGLGVEHYNLGATEHLNGWIDDFRVTKGVARYLAGLGMALPGEADNYAARVAGVITDQYAAPVARAVRAYHRVTGTLLASAQSDLSTGEYLLRLPTTAEVSRFVLAEDPSYDLHRDYVELALRCDGANDSTTVTDISSLGRTITCVGTAKLKTAQKRFGSASLYLDGSAGCYAYAATSTARAFGAGDFSIDMWAYQTARASGGAAVFDTLPLSGAGARNNSLGVSVQTDGKLAVFFAAVFRIQAGFVPLNAWTHIAVERYGGVISAYINGALVGSTDVVLDDTLGGTVMGVSSNVPTDPAYAFTGYIDDVRVTKGVARFQGPFLPPAYQQPDPANSVEVLQNDLIDRVIPG